MPGLKALARRTLLQSRCQAGRAFGKANFPAKNAPPSINKGFACTHE
jgi:hypothetical protein